MNETTWRPVADGELAEQIWQLLHEIAAALKDFDPLKPQPSNVSAAGLPADLATFFSYLAEATDDEGHAETALHFLELAIGNLQAGGLTPGLFGGFTGIAATLHHLDGRLFDLEDDGLEAIDDTLVERVRDADSPIVYDLISGHVGYAVYLLQRLPSPKARQGLESIVDAVEQLAERDGDAITWWTAPQLLPPEEAERHPKGNYNLGVAHGIPGIIAALALIHGAGVRTEQTARLLDQAVPWLLGREQFGADDLPSYFPASISEGQPPIPSRLAWCYGDIGVAVSLLAAARHRGNAGWEREAVRIARRSAERTSLDSAGVKDSGLCHGSAGLVHLFNRLYQATGDKVMAEATRIWVRHTFGIRRPEVAIAGFPMWSPNQGGWLADASLLAGVTGVGLALLATVASVEPAWDHAMLTDLPVCRAA